MKEQEQHYGTMIREIRRDYGITIARLEQISGFSRHTIIAWEQGRRHCNWWRYVEIEKIIKESLE